jgi:hypothetical protein
MCRLVICINCVNVSTSYLCQLCQCLCWSGCRGGDGRPVFLCGKCSDAWRSLCLACGRQPGFFPSFLTLGWEFWVLLQQVWMGSTTTGVDGFYYNRCGWVWVKVGQMWVGWVCGLLCLCMPACFYLKDVLQFEMRGLMKLARRWLYNLAWLRVILCHVGIKVMLFVILHAAFAMSDTTKSSCIYKMYGMVPYA